MDLLSQPITQVGVLEPRIGGSTCWILPWVWVKNTKPKNLALVLFVAEEDERGSAARGARGGAAAPTSPIPGSF